MADRPTSVAKSVEGLHHEDSALDRARALREQFTRAQNDNQQQKERPTEKPVGSQMVKEDAPALRPSPTGPMRQMPDRQAAVAKLGKEHDNAAARIEAAQKAREAFNARQQQTHDHDRDR